MAETWIEKQRQELKDKYTKNLSSREPVLEAFSIYLLRILNGLSQMESSKLYGYEAQILGEAMRLFCIHYISQVESALKQGISIEDKKEIIEDIEDAIGKISNVYKNVIDSTSNSDRQIFTSQAIETSVYDISPKLFATYSVILETLVRLFEKQGIYAFLLHPTMKSNFETVSLFDMRETEGKVVLIYIPETEIEKIGQVPTYLLHEVFHVLTKGERNRKDRACRMETHVSNAILQRIFKNVNFCFLDGDERVDKEIKKELMEKWFDSDNRIRELDRIDKDDRKFYSKNILKEICQNWRQWLSGIFVTLGNDICQVLEGRMYKQGENPYMWIMQMEWEIQRNLVEILAGNLVEQYADMYMSVYREAYADIACVLTAGISPSEYEQAFKDSETVSDVSGRDDIIRILRTYLVAKSVASCNGIKYAEEWIRYSEEQNFRKRIGSESGSNGDEEGTQCNDRIQIFDDDLESYEGILSNCSEKLWHILGQKSGAFTSFREIIGQMDLIEVLNGKVNERLRGLW